MAVATCNKSYMYPGTEYNAVSSWANLLLANLGHRAQQAGLAGIQ